ncbi:hypothetical protein DENSPDRAFT_260502 [Dentipellis sp. KUC8613]|nr:hypothetical protein DENSPDRAFT_260502 [Dentipellis sp. KUC8613]
MQNYAIAHDIQNHYNLIYRKEGREMVPTPLGVGMIPSSTLAAGFLSGLPSAQTSRGETDYWLEQYNVGPTTQEIIKRVEELAEKKETTMAKISYPKPLTDVTAPIVGATSVEKLLDLVDALEVKLDADDIQYLDEPYMTQNTIGDIFEYRAAIHVVSEVAYDETLPETPC